MAWDFAAEIHALSGFNADEASTAGNSGEVNTLHVNQWLTDGAKEVINNLPTHLLKLCSSKVAFGANSTAAGSESASNVLNTGKVFSVFAHGVLCRSIDSSLKYKAEDSGDVNYATTTDPVYYIEANLINILPSGRTAANCIYEEVQYPTVAFNDISIAAFPDEAEYLVVLYAAIRAVQERMANEAVNEDSELYALHADKYAKLSAEYAKGLAALKGGG